MENINLENYFSKSNEDSYIYLLHEYGKFDIDKFNYYLEKYDYILENRENLNYYENHLTILKNATDNLIYTIACLYFHHDKRDAFRIINYEDYDIDGLYDDFWGYSNLDNYIITKIRESIAKNFV